LEARWSARAHENGHEHDPEASHGANGHRQNQHGANAEAKHEGHDGGAELETENEKKPETDRAAGQQDRA
jgi:hypothetical protein